MKINRIFLVLLLFILSGCTTTTHWAWAPLKGQSNSQYYADKVECQQIASYRSSSAYVNQYGGSANSGQSINMGMFFDCLRGKGYKIEIQ